MLWVFSYIKSSFSLSLGTLPARRGGVTWHGRRFPPVLTPVTPAVVSPHSGHQHFQGTFSVTARGLAVLKTCLASDQTQWHPLPSYREWFLKQEKEVAPESQWLPLNCSEDPLKIRRISWWNRMGVEGAGLGRKLICMCIFIREMITCWSIH